MPIHGRESVVDGIEDLRRRADAAGKPHPSVTVWAADMDPALVRGYQEVGVERVVLKMPPVGDTAEALRLLDARAEFIRQFN
jgi:DNA-binding NarL/FixJ family response regulator